MNLREAQREAVRNALLRAGLRLLARQGFAATTVDQIASAAGVAKGTFYNYFASKEELALAALPPLLDRIQAELLGSRDAARTGVDAGASGTPAGAGEGAGRPAGPPASRPRQPEGVPAAPPGDLRGRLHHLCTRLVSFTRDVNPELIWLWCIENLRRGLEEPASHRFHLLMTRLCEEGQAAGELRRDRPAEELALDLEGIVLVRIAAWYHSGAPSGLLPRLLAAVETYLAGAAAPGSRR